MSRKMPASLVFISVLFSLLLASCEAWGPRDNPVDADGTRYDGLPTVARLADFDLDFPADGGTLAGVIVKVTKVLGAKAYQVRISTSAEALATAAAIDSASPEIDLSSTGIADQGTYWWQARTQDSDEAWGAWTVARNFTTVWVPAATPTFSPAGGTYTTDQSVAISCATSGATIYYTTDGTMPTPASTPYTGAIGVAGQGTVRMIKAIALAAGYSTSAAGSAAYTISYPAAATPTFRPAGGTYTSDQSVTISCATSGVTIYYTTDGSTPTTASTPYTGAIGVTGHGTVATIKAIAIASGYLTTTVGSAAYTISYPAAATPTFSPAGGTYSTDQSVAISCATSGATIYYTIGNSGEPADPTTSSTLYSTPIMVTAGVTG